MAWSDEPTPAQLAVIYGWFKKCMPSSKASKAMKYLEDTATRREVSDERNRVRDLDHKKKLDGHNAFESEIWEGFKYE